MIIRRWLAALLIISVVVCSSCRQNNTKGNDYSKEYEVVTQVQGFPHSDLNLGKFGKSYEKTKYLLDKLKDRGQTIEKHEINRVKIELADALRASGNYDEGIAFLLEVINDKHNNLDPEDRGKAYDRMAAIYYELYIHNRESGFFLDSSFQYCYKALEIARQLNDPVLESSTLNILGASHIYINDFIEAEKLLTEAGTIASDNNLEPELAQIANLAFTKCRLGYFSDALPLAHTCFQLASERDNFPFFLIGIELMAIAYDGLGMKAQSGELWERHRELSKLKDPIIESLLARQLIINYKHNIDKERISWLSSERFYLVGLSRLLIVALALISVFVVILVFYIRQRQKSMRLQNELLHAKHETDKLAIENAEMLLEKKEAESRLLESELASKESALASKLLTITKQNEFLIHLLERIKQVNNQTSNAATRKGFKEIIDLVRNNVQAKNWEELETIYASGNSSFIVSLTKAHPDLTSNERRLCLLLQMNLSTKEISDITMQSCRAVEMARHRLRLKFGISRDENITSYFAKFL